MEKQLVKHFLVGYLLEYGYCESGESEINDDIRFRADLGFDSLDKVEMIIETEKNFQISIPDNKIDTFITLGDFRKYLERL